MKTVKVNKVGVAHQHKSPPLKGTLQLPGGHLEKSETFFYCAEREALEETGLGVVGRKVLGVTNSVFEEGQHYVTIFVLCDVEDSEKDPVVSGSSSFREKVEGRGECEIANETRA